MENQLRKLKAAITYHEMGIVPIGEELEGAGLKHDMNKILAQLPREEARKMKRKFRKVWRAAAKAKLRHGGKQGFRLAAELGFQIQEPKRIHKLVRKRVVKLEVYKKIDDGVNSRDLW